jgi:hypothetical protein
VIAQEPNIFELHSATGIIVRIIGGEEKPLGAEKFDRLWQLRLFGLDGKIKIVLKVITRRIAILFEKKLRRLMARAWRSLADRSKVRAC